jgi:hypothetical protein
MSDSNEASEEMELDEASILRTKRLMVKELAEDLVWNLDTEKELDAAILYLIGHYFTPPVVDLDNAAVRAIWIDAHHKA